VLSFIPWLTVIVGGQSNMYMQNHRCKVTGSTSTKKLGKPKPAVYCRDNPTKCVPGPKQMMVWNRKSTPPWIRVLLIMF
jgi:hypothetical protein